MQTSVATSELCLPITALDSVLLNQRRLLLVGQGSYLHVYDLEGNRLLLTTRIFEVQAVHGICHSAERFQDDNFACLNIAISGGSSVAIASLEVGHVNTTSRGCNFDNVRVCQVPEWILKVRHRNAGTAASGFVLLTTSNCLYTLTGSAQDASGLTSDVLSQGPKSSLYSGDIGAYSRDSMLVAGGSVFGEVVVWTCKKSNFSSQWEAHANCTFRGHHGSIFGTRISPPLFEHAGSRRFVATCSDDRTIQIWDMSDRVSRTKGGAEDSLTNDTGFGLEEASSSERVAITSAHGSRIWDVDFITHPEYPAGTQKEHYLVSRGEDATCQVWSLNFASCGTDGANPNTLRFVSDDHHHSGKSVLAWTQYTDGSSNLLISGGADGRVVKRPLRLSNKHMECVQIQAFKDIRVDQKPTVLKEYLIFDTAKVIATATSELLLECQDFSGEGATWHTASVTPLTPVTKLCSNVLDHVAVAAGRDGLLVLLPGDTPIYVPLQLVRPISWMWLVSVTLVDHHQREVLLVVTFPDSEPAMLVRIFTAYPEYQPETLTLDVPNKFVITSACYAPDLDLLFLGSRTGSLLVRSGIRKDPTHPQIACDVHGPDAVTSLQVIQGNQIYQTHVLSTGRNGTFAIHAVAMKSPTREQWMQTLYKSSPQFGMNIEGAILSTSSSDNPNLILYGFQSTSFVVWNQSKQVRMLSVDCGGAHRNWSYHLSPDAKNHAFVWTKASTFNWLRSAVDTPDMVREGGHGREIKALAVRPRPGERGTGPRIIATGAEDTTIRLSALQSSMPSGVSVEGDHGFKPLVTLTEHTTGVQHLAFSSDGKYLFSSGGNGELFAWSVVDDVPIVGLGVTLLCKMVQASDDSDARILSFDIVSSSAAESATESGSPIHLVAAYSNGKVRVITYSFGPISGSSSFMPVNEIIYGSFCLIDVRFQSTPSGSRILVAGTNGCLYSHHLETPTVSHNPHGVHQSSVLAMDTIDFGPFSLVATGGDDNALAVTLMQLNDNAHTGSTNEDLHSTQAVSRNTSAGHGQNGVITMKPQTALIPKAHAAALTALKIIRHHQWVVVLTVGNDQRLKIWGIKLQTPGGFLERSLQIFRLQEAWTCVADVSNVELLEPIQGNVTEAVLTVVIVGVGLEVLQIKLNSEVLLEGP